MSGTLGEIKQHDKKNPDMTCAWKKAVHPMTQQTANKRDITGRFCVLVTSHANILQDTDRGGVIY